MQFFQKLFRYNVIKRISIIPSSTLTHFSIFLDPRITSLSAPISCRCIDIAVAAKRRRDHCNRGKSGDRTGEGKSTPRTQSHTLWRSDTLARQTSREISSGNLRRGTPARAEISSPEIGKTGNVAAVCVCVCARSLYMYVYVRETGGYFSIGISEGS